MMYKVGDKIIVVDFNGNEFNAEIININEYREPRHKYAIYINGFDDYVFVGENNIKGLQNG